MAESVAGISAKANIIDTDAFYAESCERGFVQVEAIARNEEWVTATEWGDIQITVNLSKPEKDPRDIASQASVKAAAPEPAGEQSNPALRTGPCSLCVTEADVECGYAKRIELGGEPWGLWYSPYGYYNEHCIAMSWQHRPMHIDHAAFECLLEFADKFPTYFIGSNADLPIVGGSILSHEHFQGGHYRFAMESAGIEKEISFKGYEDIHAGIVKWPMSVIRLNGRDPQRIADLADKILTAWRGYSDLDSSIIAFSDGEPHNTITPIARRRSDLYELDLVLRCNITTAEHPLGVFHPHADKHHIKKENIGLIEVMGLAVLPSRLKKELHDLADAIVAGRDIAADEVLSKHAPWVEELKKQYTFTEDNALDIILQETGKVFAGVLEDAGVYKNTPEGKTAFQKFVDYVNQEA